uniref:Uncharacterized protein n=1 Tax=Davidia involucrata TaxID=16924 RepID=A0A5B7CDB2_DAVIN
MPRVDRFAKRPDQWKLRQASKQSAYKEFYATFGSKETKSSINDSFIVETHHTSQPEKLKEIRREIDACLASATAPSLGSQYLAHEGSTTKLRMSGHRRCPERAEQHGEKFTRNAVDDDVLKSKNKKHKKKNGATENAAARSKTADDDVYHQKAAQSVDKKEKKRRRKDGLSESSLKKLKA